MYDTHHVGLFISSFVLWHGKRAGNRGRSTELFLNKRVVRRGEVCGY